MYMAVFYFCKKKKKHHLDFDKDCIESLDRLVVWTF